MTEERMRAVRAAALEEAASVLDGAVLAGSVDECEQHMNYVLMDLAAKIRRFKSK